MADTTTQENMNPDEQALAPETIKVGEKEYSQEELQALVGLGEIGREAEERYNVKLDKVWPNFQRTVGEKTELERQLEAERQRQFVPPTQEQLSEQEVAQRAREELGKLGYVPADEVKRIVNDTLQGYRLLDEAQGVLAQQVEDGNPSASVEDLLNHMQETGIRSPEKAYKDMFEAELDAIKEKKLASLKTPGIVSHTESTAGSKQPAPQKITNENLDEALRAALLGQ